MTPNEVLQRYARTWGALERFDNRRQVEWVEAFERLLASPDCGLRTHLPGHLTGAALVTTPECDRVLLTLHRKLGLWLQLGGHADGDADLARVAMREAQEESGLTALEFLGHAWMFGDTDPTPLPFDLDIHDIPARKSDPAHQHYDVRYVVVAREPERIVISEESTDLRWFTLDEAYRITDEPSMHRQFDKLAYLRAARR